MEEIELSVMSYDVGVSDLQAVLGEFETRHRVKVRITVLSWETSWAEITKFALYGHGPAVSEIGSTWVASLAAMNALRAFAPNEVSAMGGAKAFLPAAWQSGQLHNNPAVWAIPWLADVGVIFYRRDLLQAAGVDEAAAFQTQASLEQTLQRLQDSGVSMPLTLPTRPTLATLHNLASWVWGAGGDFVDEARQHVLFQLPETRRGMCNYFGLHRYLSPEARGLDAQGAEDKFIYGEAAVTVSGPWLVTSSYRRPTAERLAVIGAALPPGPPLVGASHFAIWHSIPPRLERLAVELVRFLTSKPTQLLCSQQVGMLPVRPEVFAAAPYADSPLHQVLARAAQAGRSYPAIRLWGLFEEKLVATLGHLWARVLAAPDPDVDALVQAEIEPLARRLDMILRDTAPKT